MTTPVYHRPSPPSPPIAPLHYTVLQYPPQELQHRQSAPHVPVFSASRWISPTGSYDPPPSSQPSSQMMQEPSSHTLSTVSAVPSSKGKRPAQEDSGCGITKKGRLAKKTWEQIDILREIVPHASKQDPASTLADVADYVIYLKERVDQLSKKGSVSQTTAAQYERPDSPISGLADPNQTRITHEGTSMSSSPLNHQAVDQDPASTLADVADYVIYLKERVDQLSKKGSVQTTAAQYERPGSPISGLAEPNQASITLEGTTMSGSHVNHQAVDVTGVPETTQESFSFGTTSHGNLSFDTHPFF
ncbi:hypothetical protein ACET3Z_012895 [Daucus carota]